MGNKATQPLPDGLSTTHDPPSKQHQSFVPEPLKLKKPCTYFLAGYCRNGSNCPNLHDESHLSNPNSAKQNELSGIDNETLRALWASVLSELRKEKLQRRRLDLVAEEESLRREASRRQTPASHHGCFWSFLPVVSMSIERLSKNIQSREIESDKVECCICLGTYEVGEKISILPCTHWIHTTCCTEWLKKQPCCPLCQALPF